MAKKQSRVGPPHIHVCLFRRDLRLEDHDAIIEACRECLVKRTQGIGQAADTSHMKFKPNAFLVPLYVYDPSLMRHESCSTVHYMFIDDCLVELSKMLVQHGSKLVLRVGMLVGILKEMLQYVHQGHSKRPETSGSLTIWSHHVSGHNAERQRDDNTRRWCEENGVVWRDLDTGGVLSV